MSITADRVDLSDRDAELLAQASRLMSETLDRPQAHRIALVEEHADGTDTARLDQSESSFSRAFRRRFGRAPGALRAGQT